MCNDLQEGIPLNSCKFPDLFDVTKTRFLVSNKSEMESLKDISNWI